MQTNTTAPAETNPHALLGGANLPLVVDRDDAPSIDRYSLSLDYDPGGYPEASMGYATEGAYVEHDDHLRALGFEQGRSDALQAIADAQAIEIAKLKAEVGTSRTRSYWQCDWRHRERHEPVDWQRVTTQRPTLQELYDALAVDRLALLYGYDLSEVEPDAEPEAIDFSYGRIRRILEEENIAIDTAQIFSTRSWLTFEQDREDRRLAAEAEEKAREAEEEAHSEERERAEYERLRSIYGDAS